MIDLYTLFYVLSVLTFVIFVLSCWRKLENL